MGDKKPYKRLYRSRKDKKIAGVCGGIADYFEVDPVWIRVLFLLFLFLGGAAFLLYVIMWFVVPIQPEKL